MKGNELVWRTLVDESVAGNRQWDNIADLAFKSGVPDSTTHLATKRLEEIGAITRYKAGGLSVVSPEKVLTLLCAARNLKKETVVETSIQAIKNLSPELRDRVVLGGPNAAIHHLGGINTVSDYSETIAYVDKGFPLEELVSSDFDKKVKVQILDRRAELTWLDFTSIAQTYADLFAMPGWQSSEFRIALREKFLQSRDWDQAND